MSFKTTCIIIITVLVTVFLMLNTDSVSFNLIFATKTVSKLLVIGVCFAAGFFVGLLLSRPKKPKENTHLPLSSEDNAYLEMD